MCGIAGIAGPGATARAAALRRMIASLGHRGPDGEGVFLAPSGFCALGHRRLAILDLTRAAAQPMTAADGQYTITYNGECYNYAHIQRLLSDGGGAVRSTGDTEVVLRHLAAKGPAGLADLNAMFALALWDDRRRRLLMARDRFGQKPLYWARTGDCLVFASEIRALLASGFVERVLDAESVLDVLSLGAVVAPRTIARGVSSLPAGAWMEWGAEHGECRGGALWSEPREKRPTPPRELRDQFAAAVERHLISDAPIGVFLSGGIDSSAVAVAAARCPSRAGQCVTTLSVVFPDEPEMSEAPHARRVANACRSDHREIAVTSGDLLRALPDVLAAMDQPTMDAVNTWVVSRAAREAGLKAALSGLGGDELFGGYPAFRDVPRMLRARGWLGPAAPAAGALARRLAPRSRRAEKAAELLAASGDVIDLYLARRRVFSSRQIARLAPRAGGMTAALPASLRESLSAAVEQRDGRDAVGLLEMAVYMQNVLLRDADVMGMSQGLEIRQPFLDAEFAETALRLDPAARAPSRPPKRVFLDALSDWLPRENVERPKQGFTLPFAAWMRGPLRDDVRGGLESLHARCPLFDAAAIRLLWTRFLANPDAVGWSRPWTLFVLGRFLERERLTP